MTIAFFYLVVVPLLAMYVLYLASMTILRAWLDGKVRWWLWILVGPIAVTAWCLDVLLNVLLFSVLLWEKPRPGERTISERMSRHLHGTGYRRFLARVTRAILNPFDSTGEHIK